VRAIFSLSVPRTISVSQSWRSALSADKSVPYLHTLRLLETSYTMFSINLDEAIGLRRSGHLNKAYLALSITPSLCKRLAEQVQLLLRAMLDHAKHSRIVPSISSLNPENFQHPRSRRAAGFNNLCSRIVLSRRSQFLHKASTLLDLIEDLEKAFSAAASDLKDSISLQPEREWCLLDSAHYDINTCLRESIVLLKCFLLALPPAQVPEFTAALQKRPAASGSHVLLPKRHLAHRRMALLKGQ
jgi:hypothetical protein